MKWRPVESTSIARVGYDSGRRELGVVFLQGGTYVYSGVASAVFEAFTSADSKGRFFYAHIFGRYVFRQLD